MIDQMIRNRIAFLLVCLVVGPASCLYAGGGDKQKKVRPESEKKIFTEEFKDRTTGCVITYEYYKTPEGKKMLHGRYKRQWSLSKEERSAWSGREVITARFEHGRLNGVVTINCEKYKWQRKSEYIKGKGRKISMVPVECYLANNLKLEVRNDTLAGTFNFELGNLKYEAIGKVNEAGEMQGKYTLYRRNNTGQSGNPRNTGQDWAIEEQYLCDPGYTYKDAAPKVTEVNLGYPGTSRGEQVRIKLPRMRLSINSM